MKKILFKLDNEPMSGLTHFIGLILAIIGTVFLIIKAAKLGTAWHVVSFSIFGLSLLLLYTCSMLYHFFPKNTKVKRVFLRLDHSMIFALIAGSYTPICLTVLRGGWGWSLFGVVWAIAATGISLKGAGVKMNQASSLILYVVAGWLALIAFVPLVKALPIQGLLLLLLGGMFYTMGAITFVFNHVKFHKRWFGMHEIFHIFVMFGSISHYFFVYYYLI